MQPPEYAELLHHDFARSAIWGLAETLEESPEAEAVRVQPCAPPGGIDHRYRVHQDGTLRKDQLACDMIVANQGDRQFQLNAMLHGQPFQIARARSRWSCGGDDLRRQDQGVTTAIR